MRLIELPQILAALDEDCIRLAIEDGLRCFSAGGVDTMAVGHLAFQAPPGDCHVKGGCIKGDDVFVVKLATSFYRNPELGLASSNGFIAVVSAKTGEVLAILHDQGQLTDLRTAMTGAIAARVIARPHPKVLGIVGTGTQARLQGQQVSRLLGTTSTLVWGRTAERAAALADELGAESVPLNDLCVRADVIVTTTPSTEPILTAAMVPPGARIIAVGADASGKQELAVDLLAGARIVVDSRAQCVDHGDTGWAVRAGLVDPGSLVELGELLTQPSSFRDDETVVVDLTGLGVQDLQIAKAVWSRLQTDFEPFRPT